MGTLVWIRHLYLDTHAAAPAVYAQTGRAITKHTTLVDAFTGAELQEFGYEGYDELTPQEQLEGIEVPYLSVTYADDGVLVAPQIPRFVEATKASYIGFMKAALGPEAVSDKDLAEQQWSQKQIVIGHLFVLGAEADARGHRDFLMPTQARITLMLEVMSDVQFTPEGKDTLTAGLCAKAFSLWLWMCIPCVRLKAFNGSFKRPLEGRVRCAASDIVTPVRAGCAFNLG